jgi:tetratricopeptide (TPR) repeat protein
MLRWLLLIGLLLAVPSPAKADSQAEREARLVFQEGNKLLEAGDYVGALDMYRSAYAKFPSPRILLNMGTALKALGRNAEAAEAYEKYLASPDADKKRIKEVQKIVADLNAGLGKLKIVVNEPGAKVLVNGEVVGESPQEITLRREPGSYTVVAQKEGFPAALATVALKAGDERAVELRLDSSAPPPPPDVEDPDVTGPIERPAPTDTAPRWYHDKLGWGLTAVGVVAVGVGIGLTVSASGMYDDADAALDEQDAIALNDDANGRATIGAVTLGVGAALVVGGVIRLVLHDSPSGAAGTDVAVGPGWIGVVGRF